MRDLYHGEHPVDMTPTEARVALTELHSAKPYVPNPADAWQTVEDWLTEVIADSFYAHWHAIDGARAIVARIKAGDFPGLVAPLPVRGTECPSSHEGRHHVDTSMESGPNNCFHCERKMP